MRNKVAVITGGSRGIGAAIARKFAAMGADIALIYAGNDAGAEEVRAACEAMGVRARAYRCDVADYEAVKETIAGVKADLGGIHILVNNAGITRDGLILRMREETWDEVMDTNLKGAFHLIRHVAPLFLRAGEGCILNISSVSGLMGNAGQSNYAASKSGLIGLTKSVARELASRNIRVNAIAPGFIQTDMTEDQTGNPMLAAIPMGRMGTPEEVAEAAAFLACAGYITGEVLRVDGGIAM